jgi:hypothetical protein
MRDTKKQEVEGTQQAHFRHKWNRTDKVASKIL